uniref:Uncharacterized protein n=1 Tax=viral metagenome TaxID=1070528 RepID=A0A6M3JJ05_9ZZZZ
MPDGIKPRTTEEAIWEIYEIAQKNHNELQEVRIVLLGVPHTDEDGLVGFVRRNSKRIDQNNSRINKLYVVLALIIGGGGYGGYELFKFLSG